MVTFGTWCLGGSVLLAAMGAAEGAYRIGQREVPEVVVQTDPSKLEVYAGHPRLYFRDTDLPAIRARMEGSHQAEWQEMRQYLEDRLLPADPEKYARGVYLKGWVPGRNMAFAACVTGDAHCREWALRWAETLAADGPVGNDSEYRGRLMSLAVAYDWLYPWLSDAQKARLQEAILAHLERCWYFAERADFVGGHSRWGNFALAAGLLALVTERPELREKLLAVRKNWVDGFHPAQAWIATDGGYHMGWTYSGPYLSADNHCVWTSATNECLYYPWQAKLPEFWIYGKQGNGRYPNTGDAYSSGDSLNASDRELLMVAAGVFKNPRAAWMVAPTWDRFADILFGDKSVAPLPPDDARDPLPRGRHFGNAGVVIARDRWDEETTHLQFRSVPFYSANHHHRDENSFTLHYRGDLAIDSGLYDEGGPDGGYGGTHWRNYFTRTVAHNAIVVFDPQQQMTVYGKPVSNDGGQTYRQEPKGLADIAPGGHAHLDGITGYRDTEDYTYAAGDATRAYDPERVRLAQREVVYLRRTARAHPVVVVFDRVESARPEFEKRFLLHTVNQPSVAGRMAVAENKGGRLSCLTLLPEDANLQLVGGEGKEFWVDGRNYPISPAARRRGGLEPGAWRLEVSPGAPRTLDHFLHVLFADDADAPAVDPAAARLVRGDGEVGVEVAGWSVRFATAPGGAARVERAR